MFNSKDIRAIEFEEVKRGYNKTDVKAFLRTLADQIDDNERAIADLTAQRDSLKVEAASANDKVMVLAEKVEEYRKDEDSLRTALLSAQRLSDTIIKEAKENSEIIVNDARNKAEDIINGISDKVNSENEALKTMQAEVSKFKSDVLSIYKSHLEILSMIPELPHEEKAIIQETPVQVVEPVTEIVEEEIVADETKVFDTVVEPIAPIEPVIVETTVEVENEPFYAPVVPLENDPFTSFSVNQETPIEEELVPSFEVIETIDTETTPEENQEEPPKETSRFGQLDFGDGFSFRK